MTRKRLVIALALLVAIFLFYFSFYLSYVSCFVGFIVARYGGSKQEGKPGRVSSVIVSWRRYHLHLHHWVIAFLTSGICALKGVYMITPELFYGFLGGLILQGIYCYDDWHRIIFLRSRCEPDS